MGESTRTHWETVYSTRPAASVSWYEASPEASLSLIRACGLSHDASILDVGAGNSRLPDALLSEGYRRIAVLDISQVALQQTRARLGAQADAVMFICADITAWSPEDRVDLWHDRALLHFLTEPAQRLAYAKALRAAVRPGGFVVIFGFAPSGPERCSGLPVARSDHTQLAAILGPDFLLQDAFERDHVTPNGARQRFSAARFRRKLASATS